ncbi:NAD(P)-binding domain-containing protein [Microbacterium sp. A8/3-1]|uniref:NAD(P)-binding domain-containing protein n=1 Tax=Microbacterium sp. A8/3-1 TaxID=3160749 RepID=A0AAU7VQV9_9MICO
MKILVLGSGVMAAGIAGQLAKHHDITMLSRHLDPAVEDFRVAATLEDATSECYAAVLSCVADDQRSRALWLDERMEALIRRDRPVVAELSTLSLSWIEEWHQRMDALEVVAVESPVTGSRSGAEAGTLSSFRFSKARSHIVDEIFAVFTDHIYEFSAPGNPTRFKLIYNSWGAAILATLGPHAELLSTHLHEDFDLASTIVQSDGWMAPVVNSKWARYRDRDFDNPDFRLSHMVKDLNYLRPILRETDVHAHQVRMEYEASLTPETSNLDFAVVSRYRPNAETAP